MPITIPAARSITASPQTANSAERTRSVAEENNRKVANLISVVRDKSFIENNDHPLLVVDSASLVDSAGAPITEGRWYKINRTAATEGGTFIPMSPNDAFAVDLPWHERIFFNVGTAEAIAQKRFLILYASGSPYLSVDPADKLWNSVAHVALETPAEIGPGNAASPSSRPVDELALLARKTLPQYVDASQVLGRLGHLTAELDSSHMSNRGTLQGMAADVRDAIVYHISEQHQPELAAIGKAASELAFTLGVAAAFIFNKNEMLLGQDYHVASEMATVFGHLAAIATDVARELEHKQSATI